MIIDKEKITNHKKCKSLVYFPRNGSLLHKKNHTPLEKKKIKHIIFTENITLTPRQFLAKENTITRSVN